MQGTYKLMKDNVYVGEFIIDSINDVFRYTAVAAMEYQPLLFERELESKTVLDGEIVQIWLTTRAPEPNYAFIDALMERVGITKYDPWAFIEYNGGKFNTDNYYLEKMQ